MADDPQASVQSRHYSGIVYLERLEGELAAGVKEYQDAYQAGAGEFAQGSECHANLVRLYAKLMAKIDEIQKGLDHVWGLGDQQQGAVSDNRAGLDALTKSLKQDIDSIATVQGEIGEMGGEAESRALQARSHWLQAIVLGLVFVAIAWRTSQVATRQDSSDLDWIILAAAALLIFYHYWNAIWGTAEEIWDWIVKQIMNIGRG